MSGILPPPKKSKVYYRYICEHCIEVNDCPGDQIQIIDGIGEGTDISGYSVIRMKCDGCDEVNESTGSLEKNMKGKRIFKMRVISSQPPRYSPDMK
jgi:hypothetical protein